MSRFNWAPEAYRMLNGIMCVFKPEGTPVHKVIQAIKLNLTRDLNALPCYQHEIPLKQTSIQENTHVSDVSLKTQPGDIQDWSEHRLVLGDRFEETDIKLPFVDGISSHTSGVLVLGIGLSGQKSINRIAHSKFLRVYHVKGRFGWATDNYSPKGRIIERTSYKHVTKSKLEKVCATAQANHTRQMYQLHKVNPDSHEAYELAASGLIRPAERGTEPVLYGVRCIDFQLPDFTLEIHCINETCPYLRCLIHELALKLKTTAVCSGIRRIRYGYFDLHRTLLRQHWHLDSIVDNIENNMNLLTPDKLYLGPVAKKVKLLPIGHSAGYLSKKQFMIGEDQNDIDSSGLTDESNHAYEQRVLVGGEVDADISERREIDNEKFT